MSGLLLESEDVILEMDETLEDVGGRSQIVPVYLKKMVLFQEECLLLFNVKN